MMKSCLFAGKNTQFRLEESGLSLRTIERQAAFFENRETRIGTGMRKLRR